MVEMIFPDGTYVSSIVANLNVFTSNPATSKGEGEIIYNSTTNKVYVNIGTTESPNWYDISGSGEPTSHDLLDNLNWASAGHTFDATLNLNSNNLTSVAGLAFGTNPTISVPSGSTYYFKALTTDLLSLNTTTNTSYQPLAMSSEKITGLAAPTTNGDAVRYEHLSADDHTQYFLADGSRDLTGDLTFDKSSPTINFDTGDNLSYDKVSNIFAIKMGGDYKFYLTSSSGVFNTNLIFLGTNPTIGFTSNNYFQYVTATNLLNFSIANTIEYEFGATALDVKSNKITGLATPTADTDAATKAYSDLVGVTVCTSSTRPSATEGKVIYETDTDLTLVYEGASWESFGGWTGTATSDLDMDDYNITNADTVQAKSTNSLTFKVSTGKSFVFQKV